MSIKNKIDGIKEIWHFDNHWQIIFNRILFSRENINIYRKDGMEILVDHSAGDANGAREVFATDMYRKFIRSINFENEINVLDLGSNNGGFPLLLKSEGLRLKKVVCVEFNPQTYSRLQFNLARNLDVEYTAVNAAVCGKSELLKIGFGASSTSDSIYGDTSAQSVYTADIQGVTFDALFNQHFVDEIVDICKIDIEGAEFEVFEKGECESLRQLRHLLIEIHHEPGRPRESVQRKIESLGFSEIDGESKIDQNHYVHYFVNNELIERGSKD